MVLESFKEIASLISPEIHARSSIFLLKGVQQTRSLDSQAGAKSSLHLRMRSHNLDSQSNLHAG